MEVAPRTKNKCVTTRITPKRRTRKPAKIYLTRNRNGTMTHRVEVGRDETGKRVAHGFQNKEDAGAFKKKHDEALELEMETPVPDQGVPRVRTEAKIYEVRNPSGNVISPADFNG